MKLAYPQLPNLMGGRCGESDVDFYSESAAGVAAAKEVCGTCQLKSRCSDWAVAHEEFGIWGGMTHLERRAIRRRLQTRMRSPQAYVARGEPTLTLDETPPLERRIPVQRPYVILEEVKSRTGATINQLRYWVRTGLITPINGWQRTPGVKLLFTPDEVEHIRNIMIKLADGWSLQQIRLHGRGEGVRGVGLR